MLAELLDGLVWIIRAALVAGLFWGAWLCLGYETVSVTKAPRLERFATFALLILLLTTLAGIIHAG